MAKKIPVYVELKARFDEENNIFTSETDAKGRYTRHIWSAGRKVHAKVALILRRSIGGTNTGKSFAFLSTGNFNEKTAKVIFRYRSFLPIIHKLSQNCNCHIARF